MKHGRIYLRVTEREMRVFKAHAAMKGISLSSFMRKAAKTEIKRHPCDREEIGELLKMDAEAVNLALGVKE